MTMQPVAPGEILAGKYRIERVLGEGGMGVVVAATHVSLDQRVAIKFLLPAALSNPEVVARFAREARAAAKIRGEHVARVIDVGELPSGAPYMVMEYLEGEDLAAALERRGPLPVEETVDYILQASEALAEAHGAGIVHRDIKPANLFASRAPDHSVCIKVLDFGISKAIEKDSAALTRTSAVLGSAFYLSPEQLTQARNVDARADVWALGVVLYQLLTGHVPFDGESMPEVVAGILRNVPTPPGQYRPDLPPGLATVIATCLKSEAAYRYPSVLELVQALAPFAPTRGAATADRVARVLGGANARSTSPLASSHGIAGSRPSGAVAPLSLDPPLPASLVTSSAEHAALPLTPMPARSPHERTNMHWSASDAGLPARPNRAALYLAGAIGATIFLTGSILGAVFFVVPHFRGATTASSSAVEAPSAIPSVTPSASVAATAPDAGVAAVASVSPSAATSVAVAPSATVVKTSTPHTGSGTSTSHPKPAPSHNAFTNMDVK